MYKLSISLLFISAFVLMNCQGAPVPPPDKNAPPKEDGIRITMTADAKRMQTAEAKEAAPGKTAEAKERQTSAAMGTASAKTVVAATTAQAKTSTAIAKLPRP